MRCQAFQMGGWQHRGTQTAWRRLACLRARAMHCAPLSRAALAVTSAPSSARHSHRLFHPPPPTAGLFFFFPCNFPTPRRISWPSSLQPRRRNFVAAWQQLHGTRCTSAHPPRANAPAARQASSCIMHTHPAPCLLERARNAAGQIPPSLGQAQIPYAEAATLGTNPESLQASMAIDGQATV